MVKINITVDPNGYGARTENAANLDGAVAHAMRCGRTCTVQKSASRLGGPERTVRLDGGRVASDESADDVAWWAKLAAA